MRQMLGVNLQAVVAQQLVPCASGVGRVSVAEILVATPRIRQMIADGYSDLTVGIEAGRDAGMRTMDDDLVRLVEKGTISTEAAWFRFKDKQRLPPQGNT